MKKQRIKEMLYLLLIIISCWVSISTMIEALLNPKMTQTELFLHIPQSVIFNWDL